MVLSNGTAIYQTKTVGTGNFVYWGGAYYSGAGNYSSATTANSVSVTNGFGIANGHGNALWWGGTIGGGFSLRREFSWTAGANQVIAATQLVNPQDIEVVVAPEPTTFLMFGLGAAALLKRRRKA
jgi:hypothetical protein